MEQDSKERISDTLQTSSVSGLWEIGDYGYHDSSDTSLFSSSMPILSHEKLNLAHSDSCHSLDDGLPNLNKLDIGNAEKDLLEDIEPNFAGILLPNDEDELLARIMDEFDFSGLLDELDDQEECDVFGSGGGMELDVESQESLSASGSKMHISEGGVANGFDHRPIPNSTGRVSVEHPYGEHPSRTLFVRNINSSAEDTELRSLFEPYGDIRNLYTACKHRGFVMISYYDIRAARAAMRALQNKLLRKRRLDIHFSIPKDNPSEKDINQGTLVIFNLDALVLKDDLFRIFGAYGEIKEIRETPQKRHHKFIEYYDVRDAETALKALNRSEIAGKRIKLELSRPGGARRPSIPLPRQEFVGSEAQTFHNQVGSAVANSPPGTPEFGSPVEGKPLHAFPKSSGRGILRLANTTNLFGLASILPQYPSGSPTIPPLRKNQRRSSHANQIFANRDLTHGSAYLQSHPLPEQKLSAVSRPMFAFAEPNSSGFKASSGSQFLLGSPTSYHDYASSSGSTSSAGEPFLSGGQGFTYAGRQTSLLGAYQLNVGSAPSGIHLDRHLGYFPESPETSFTSSVGFGVSGINRNYRMNIGARAPADSVISLFPGSGSYQGFGTASNEGFVERGRVQQLEACANQIINSNQCHINLDIITSGQDSRTTLMIKNIPNKYTYKMLLAEIDENHKGTYDFLDLPIDFKNKCNMGYAFINMVSPFYIIPFYQTFNGKRWEKFNTGRAASLVYSQIQGKGALIANIRNSGVVNEGKQGQ